MNTHDKLITKWKKDPKFKKAYFETEEEFILFDQMLSARKEAGLTQAQVAEKMHTKAPAIARLESSSSSQKHSPSLSTLRKYAKALGCRLIIRIEKCTSKNFAGARSVYK